jgi:CheY-like chemotaxis protein
LSFSRKEEAKKVIHSLHRPIDRAVALLRPLLPPTVTLSVATEPTPPRVLGDGTQLQQVFINLGTNAWHALDGKPGRITITQDQVSVVAADNPGLLPPARYARVVVADDGHGMDNTILPRIFEPFFTTKPSGVGSGLGLAMVHNIIRDHGGSVTVDSVLGEGTSFTVLLPIASGASESERPPSPVAAQPAEGPLHVMVVDDEQVLGRAAARFLGKLGYAASVFTEPREALVAFGIDPSEYDVLVLDLHMPGLTGLELARAALELRPGVPVILVSGRLDAKHHDAARALGVVEVLQKPYGLAELSDAILKAARR